MLSLSPLDLEYGVRGQIVTRDEFLRRLQAELVLSVSEGVIENQLSYYQEYINGELAKGRSEAEVIGELGDPRLLARTIIDAAEAGGDTVALETPFRYTEEEINYNSDDEDRQYQGAQEDSGSSRETYRSFGERTRNDGGAAQERSFDGQTVENDSRSYDREPQRPHIYTMGGSGCILFGIFLIALLSLAARVIGGIFMLLSPVLTPVMVLAVLAWFVYSAMNRK